MKVREKQLWTIALCHQTSNTKGQFYYGYSHTWEGMGQCTYINYTVSLSPSGGHAPNYLTLLMKQLRHFEFPMSHDDLRKPYLPLRGLSAALFPLLLLLLLGLLNGLSNDAGKIQ